MKVFKFGGASIKNAQAIKNVASILKSHSNDQLLVVVSAMGKTTNALEDIVKLAYERKDFSQELEAIRSYHYEALANLLLNESIKKSIDEVIESIAVEATKDGEYDQIYDQIVSQGEVLSTILLSHFLHAQDLSIEWVDARKFISTDQTYREGKVNWEKTRVAVQSLKKILSTKIIVTQGFIGSTPGGHTTTLGR